MVEKAFNIIIKHGVEGEGKRAFEAASHLFDESSSSRGELVRRMDLKSKENFLRTSRSREPRRWIKKENNFHYMHTGDDEEKSRVNRFPVCLLYDSFVT